MTQKEDFWFKAHTLIGRMQNYANKEKRIDVENYIQDLADHFGFDLVKRVSAQEAHEFMLEKRKAEDGAEETMGFR